MVTYPVLDSNESQEVTQEFRAGPERQDDLNTVTED